MKRTRRLTVATALCGAVLALGTACALAQSPTADGYDESGLSTLSPMDAAGSDPGSPPGAEPSAPGGADPGGAGAERLAFTGFGLPLLALLGGGLMATGALIRWRLRGTAA